MVLFRLGRTLKYKHKQGRDFAHLQSELAKLVLLVEGLPDADVADHPAWRQLATAVTSATRKAELRRAEDPIDAVLCAYVARFATERPDEVTIYGEPRTRLHRHPDAEIDVSQMSVPANVGLLRGIACSDDNTPHSAPRRSFASAKDSGAQARPRLGGPGEPADLFE